MMHTQLSKSEVVLGAVDMTVCDTKRTSSFDRWSSSQIKPVPIKFKHQGSKPQ